MKKIKTYILGYIYIYIYIYIYKFPNPSIPKMEIIAFFFFSEFHVGVRKREGVEWFWLCIFLDIKNVGKYATKMAC
jgi:hypothetical protein